MVEKGLCYLWGGLERWNFMKIKKVKDGHLEFFKFKWRLKMWIESVDNSGGKRCRVRCRVPLRGKWK